MTNNAIALSLFSKNREVLSGTLPFSEMPRLQKTLAAEAVDAAAAYTLRGEGELFLNVSVKAVLPLLCQRCLQQFDYQLDVARRFKLQTGKEEENYCEEYEILEADKIVPAEFIEEEIILSLPFVSAHALPHCSAAPYIAA